MAHFIGHLQGARGPASRLGGKSSGIDATARGWDLGGNVNLQYNEQTEQDSISFTLDAGSNGRHSSKTILTLTQEEADKVLKGEIVLKVVLLHPSFDVDKAQV